MTVDGAKLSDTLGDPDALAVAVRTSEALLEWGKSSGWPDGYSAWGINGLGERRVYGNASEAGEHGAETIYLVRTGPLRLEFEEANATTKDAFSCRAVVTIEVRVSSAATDLQAFRDRLMGTGSRFGVSDLAAHLGSTMAPLIRGFVGRHRAGVLVDAQYGEAFAQHVCEGLAAIFFASGMVLSGAPSLRCESAGLAGVRSVERRAAREKQRLALVADVRACQREAREHRLEAVEGQLARLGQLADSDPELSLADLVRAFSESERAEVYEALIKLRPAERRTGLVAVASAGELTFIDPKHPSEAAKRVALEGEAGPLRSVQCAQDEEGRPILLVGARGGVYLMGPDEEKPRQTCLIGGEEQGFRGGVNSMALEGKTLLASHSEAGLLRWDLDSPERSESLLLEQTRGAGAVRHVECVGDSVWLTIDHRILRLPAGDLRAEAAVSFEGNAIPVTSLCVGETCVVAGTQTGRILCWEVSDPTVPKVLDAGRGRPVESVQLVSGGGLDRLVFADSSGGITARFLDDAFGCRYQGGGQEVRRVSVRDDLLAGINTPRDRVLLWRPHEPAAPMAILPVSGWTGHSVQDLCLIPGSSG